MPHQTMSFMLSLALICLLAMSMSCSSGSSAAPPASLVLTVVPASPGPDVPPQATSSPATAVPATATVAAAAASATPVVATSTVAPAANSAPVPAATATSARSSAQTGPIQFKPAQIVQGGTAVVYLTQPATAATARFGGLLFPMLQDGNRWWTLLAVGALATPGSAPVSITYTPAGGTTQLTANASITIAGRDFPVERIDLDAQTTALLAPDIVTAELNQRAGIYGVFTPQHLWSGAFVRPNSAAIGDVYGIGRSYNGAPVTDYHRGVDFIGLTGSPVVAAAAGRVAFAGELKVRGNSVIIDHGAGVFTGYHHFSRIDVTQGQMVAAGQQIGLVGATGLVTGPHLHWEVIVRSVEVDGELWLKGAEIGP